MRPSPLANLFALHVAKSNPAQRLYERLGFSAAGEHSMYLR